MSGQWLTILGNPAAVRISSVDALYQEGNNVVALVDGVRIGGGYSSMEYAKAAYDEALEAIGVAAPWLTLTGDDGKIIKRRPSDVTGVDLIPTSCGPVVKWTVRVSQHSGRAGVTYADKDTAVREFEAALALCGAT